MAAIFHFLIVFIEQNFLKVSTLSKRWENKERQESSLLSKRWKTVELSTNKYKN